MGFEILIFLNNFINDLGVAFVFVNGGGSYILARRGLKNPSFRELNFYVSKKLNKLMYFLVPFALGGALLRYSTMDSTEWVDAVSHGQTLAFGVKYGLLFVLYIFGLLLWFLSTRFYKQTK